MNPYGHPPYDQPTVHLPVQHPGVMPYGDLPGRPYPARQVVRARRQTRHGLHFVIGVLRGAHPGTGRVRVCADQPALVRLLRAEGLDRLFPLVSRPDPPAVAARP